MSEQNAAQRYARALVEAVGDTAQVEQVVAQLAEFNTFLMGEGRELHFLLTTPIFDLEERFAVLKEIFPKFGLLPLTSNFLFLLADRDRVGSLPTIVDVLQKLVDEAAGRVRVQLTSAQALTDDMAAEFKAAFAKSTGKEVVLDVHTDSSLLGGVVARIGDRVYDASVKTRLEDIKHRLINAPASAEA